MNTNKINKMIEEIEDTECITEMCKQKPHLVLKTQCGIGKYAFKSIGYRDNELILEFKLIMDNKHSDCERIAYNIGNRCVLTAAQYLYAYEYNAFA